METTREESARERFNRAKEARERAEKEKSYGQFAPVSMPHYETVCLKPNTSHVIRMTGESIEMHKCASDPIVVSRSMIKDDDGKWFGLIWSQDMSHPMNELRKVVLGKYKWNAEKKTRDYDNADIDVFKRFMTNNNENPSPYDRGMNPTDYILMNVICRDDDWCKNNRHTKLLCWDSQSVEKDGKIVEYPTYGIKKSLYNTVWQERCTICQRHFEDFDILVRRLDSKTKVNDKYLVINIKEEKTAIKNWESLDGKSYLDKMDDDYLSDDERSYEKYDLENIPFISQPTPCGVILKHLGNYIKAVDKQFGTHIYEKFVEMKAKEIELAKGNADDTASTVTEMSVSEMVDVAVDDSLPTPVEETVMKKVVKAPSSSFSLDSFRNDFPVIDRLSDNEKSLIVGYDTNSGNFKFNSSCMAECPNCNNEIPDEFGKCIYCGAEFE